MFWWCYDEYGKLENVLRIGALKSREHDIPIVLLRHYSDVIMDAMASQITSLTVVYLIVYSGAD